MRLNLTASGKNQELVLAYLEENASDVLAEKINKGTKTMDDCWKFITGEAKKKAKDGCACIEDVQVYGWAVHFFEEDSIKPGTEYINTGRTVKTKDGERAERVKAIQRPKEEPKTTKEPKNELAGQISLFDFAGANT